MKSENHDNYNEPNFENLINHYENELKRILRGVSVHKILSKSEKETLLRSGVLIREGRGPNVQWMVSKHALDTLKRKLARTIEEMFLLGCKEFDSKKNNESKKHLLSSGIPCTIHNCVKCCIETRMPISRFDVQRIKRQGYRFKDFVVKRRKECYLKNSDGRCVFLGDNGCIIYSFRPEGCRLYPLVYNENYEKVVIHDLCPYGHEFKVSRDDIENLFVLFKKLRAHQQIS